VLLIFCAPQAKIFKYDVYAKSKIKTISRFQEKSLVFQAIDPNFKTIQVFQEIQEFQVNQFSSR